MANTRNAFMTYVMVFAATLSLFLSGLVAAALYIQPLEGELTRLGSYAERDFGWNQPQRKVRGDARLATEYQEYSDVLIIGDSFSTNGIWQPFFEQYTGLSYTTLDIRKTSLQDLLESGPFRKHPPMVMILESVERELLFFFRDLNFSCSGKIRHDLRIPFKGSNSRSQMEYYEEKRKTFDLRNINLKYAASVMVNSFLRTVSSGDSDNTNKFYLTNTALFSNRRSGELLVYEGDMQKLTWRSEDVARAACAIRGLQDRVQSNETTLFIFMLAPDKSTAYAEFIAFPEFRNTLRPAVTLEDYGVNVPRLDLILRAAIHRGEKDIYIPSGTHWSARGYALAAEEITGFIKKRSSPSP